MTKYSKFMAGSALALIVALTACGKQAVAPQAPAAHAQVAAGQQAGGAKATVLGALNDGDWYMVVSAQGAGKKPLVIWTESKPACDQNVAEFSLKAIDPASPAEPPTAWCRLGKDVRVMLGA